MTSRVIEDMFQAGSKFLLLLAFAVALAASGTFAGGAFADEPAGEEDGVDPVQQEIRDEIATERFKRGLRFLQKGKDKEAIKSFEETIKVDPSSYNTRLLLAKLYASNRQASNAVKTLREAINVRPEDPRAYDLLISLFLFTNRAEEAVEVGELALSNGVNDKSILDLGWAYYMANMLDKAEKRYERELEFRKDLYATYRNLGILYYVTGRYDASLIYYQKAEDAVDEPEEVPLLVALTYESMGNKAAVRESVAVFKLRAGDGYTSKAGRYLKKLFPHFELPDMNPYIYSFSPDKIQEMREEKSAK